VFRAPPCGATTVCVAFPAAPQLERGMTWRCGLTARPDGQRQARKHRPRSGRRRVEMAADFHAGLAQQGERRIRNAEVARSIRVL